MAEARSSRRRGSTPGSSIPGSNVVPGSETEGKNWRYVGGEVREGGRKAGYTAAGAERLTYNNPYGQEMERVWFDGKVVYAIELGQIEIDVKKVKVAQEYQVVYKVELTKEKKLVRPAEEVEGQLNIYDSVPGMDKYSPLWQFNYVIVPRSYVPNTLRSEADCLAAGYEIVRSTVVEN